MYNQVSSQFDHACRSDNFFYRIINGYQKYGVFPEDFLLIFFIFPIGIPKSGWERIFG